MICSVGDWVVLSYKSAMTKTPLPDIHGEWPTLPFDAEQRRSPATREMIRSWCAGQAQAHPLPLHAARLEKALYEDACVHDNKELDRGGRWNALAHQLDRTYQHAGDKIYNVVEEYGFDPTTAANPIYAVVCRRIIASCMDDWDNPVGATPNLRKALKDLRTALIIDAISYQLFREDKPRTEDRLRFVYNSIRVSRIDLNPSGLQWANKLIFDLENFAMKTGVDLLEDFNFGQG